MTNLEFDILLESIRQRLAIRIQFACFDTLVAECIVQGTKEAERVTNTYLNLFPGAAIHYRADLKRVWDVPVGASISQYQ